MRTTASTSSSLPTRFDGHDSPVVVVYLIRFLWIYSYLAVEG
jgi:hypothetical protein